MVSHTSIDKSGDSGDKSASYQSHSIRVMVIAESLQQRQAFTDTINDFGLRLVGCLAPQDIVHHPASISDIKADIWLVDSQYDDALYHQLDAVLSMANADSEQPKRGRQGLVLVGFDQAPNFNEIHLYAKWQRKLKRKLVSMLNLPKANTRSTSGEITRQNYKPWQYVLLLVASDKDIPAVTQFLDTLPAHLPVAAILTQQITTAKIHTLPQVISQNNDWQSQVILVSLTMQAGHCYIAPPQSNVVYDSTGRAIVTETELTDDAVPCFSKIIENCSDAFGEQLISILFANARLQQPLDIKKIEKNDSQLWQQTAETLLTREQRMQTQTKLPQYRGSSLQLAHYMSAYIDHQQGR